MPRNQNSRTYSDKRSLVVNEIMSFPVITAEEKTSIKAVARKMKDHDIDTIVITNKVGEPIGMITEGDIVRRLLSKKRNLWFSKAKHVMSKPVLTIGEYVKVEDVAKYMVEKKVKRLCVVNGERKLKGIVTQTDIIKNASYLIDVLREIIETGYSNPEEENAPLNKGSGIDEESREYAKGY